MRRHIVVVIAGIGLLSLGCAHRRGMDREAAHSMLQPGEFATDPEVVPVLWQMFGDAGFGFRHTEEAAFIVGNGDGGFIFVRWPSGAEPDTARWTGPMPGRVVAIVHTHPNWLPLPSRIDIRTAKQSHVPVYVVTRRAISKTSGGSPEIVLSGDWRR